MLHLFPFSYSNLYTYVRELAKVWEVELCRQAGWEHVVLEDRVEEEAGAPVGQVVHPGAGAHGVGGVVQVQDRRGERQVGGGGNGGRHGGIYLGFEPEFAFEMWWNKLYGTYMGFRFLVVDGFSRRYVVSRLRLSVALLKLCYRTILVDLHRRSFQFLKLMFFFSSDIFLWSPKQERLFHVVLDIFVS